MSRFVAPFVRISVVRVRKRRHNQAQNVTLGPFFMREMTRDQKVLANQGDLARCKNRQSSGRTTAGISVMELSYRVAKLFSRGAILAEIGITQAGCRPAHPSSPIETVSEFKRFMKNENALAIVTESSEPSRESPAGRKEKEGSFSGGMGD